MPRFRKNQPSLLAKWRKKHLGQTLWQANALAFQVCSRTNFYETACSLTIWKAHERTTLDEITILDQPLRLTGFLLQYYRYKCVQIRTPPYGFVHTAKPLTGGKDWIINDHLLFCFSLPNNFKQRPQTCCSQQIRSYNEMLMGYLLAGRIMRFLSCRRNYTL